MRFGFAYNFFFNFQFGLGNRVHPYRLGSLAVDPAFVRVLGEMGTLGSI